MAKTFFVLFLTGFFGLLLLREPRRKLTDWAKELSDTAIMFLFRTTSRFGRALTNEGQREQQMWQEQRLRYLRPRKREESQ